MDHTELQRSERATARAMDVAVSLATPGALRGLAWLRIGVRPGTWTIASVVSIIVFAAVAFMALRVTGGSPNALNHLGYAPVVLAAYLFGWRAGLTTAIGVAALLGPGLAASGTPTDGAQAWLIRASAFVLVGTVTGFLFDRVRMTVASLADTVVAVTEREREGMVALARGAEAKDTDTGDHVRRVQLTTEELARTTGLDSAHADAIGWAAMLHDVGKLHVPDRILLKPGPLDAEEWAIMRQHSIWGEQILGGGPGFALARRIARSHHEDFDGSGYPDGLRGARIPLEARIIRVADAFDAMTNLRPYSLPRTYEEALEELDRFAGRQFDPELVALMIELVRGDAGLRARLDRLRDSATFIRA